MLFRISLWRFFFLNEVQGENRSSQKTVFNPRLDKPHVSFFFFFFAIVVVPQIKFPNWHKPRSQKSKWSSLARLSRHIILWSTKEILNSFLWPVADRLLTEVEIESSYFTFCYLNRGKIMNLSLNLCCYPIECLFFK